jgi:hypothetical protein
MPDNTIQKVAAFFGIGNARTGAFPAWTFNNEVINQAQPGGCAMLCQMVRSGSLRKS